MLATAVSAGRHDGGAAPPGAGCRRTRDLPQRSTAARLGPAAAAARQSDRLSRARRSDLLARHGAGRRGRAGQCRNSDGGRARDDRGGPRQHLGPAHQYLLRHKKVADGVGVAVDVIGVIAGAAFVIALTPELGALAIVTGAAAGIGSLVLLAADGYVFVPELLGDEAKSQRHENAQWVQWARIVGTAMTLIDLPVGGVRALAEVGKLGREAHAALTEARSSDGLAALARERAAQIHHPAKHPGPVNRRLHRAKVLARQAEAQRQTAHELTNKMRVVAARDVTASFVATPVGTALIVGSPPAIILSERQAKADENYLKSLEPEKGMPHDVKLEVRASAVGKAARQ